MYLLSRVYCENEDEDVPDEDRHQCEPFSALAFKIVADPYVGKLTYFRVTIQVRFRLDLTYTILQRVRGKGMRHWS